MGRMLAESLRAALASVRANAVAMAILWTVAATTVAAYFLSPGFAAALEPLKEWQTGSGWAAAAANRMAFCGLLPGIFLFAVKSVRPRRPALTVLAYCAWAALWGVLCDVFFTFQASVFGSGRDLVTVASKTAVDQLVWTALLCTPANTVFFGWVAADFGRISIADALRRGYWTMLFANWIVWLPVTAAIYMFPLALQIQLVGFAGAFWMLAALAAGSRSKAGRKKGEWQV